MSIVLQAARTVAKRCAKLSLHSFGAVYKPKPLYYKPKFDFSTLFAKKAANEDYYSHFENSSYTYS